MHAFGPGIRITGVIRLQDNFDNFEILNVLLKWPNEAG